MAAAVSWISKSNHVKYELGSKKPFYTDKAAAADKEEYAREKEKVRNGRNRMEWNG